TRFLAPAAGVAPGGGVGAALQAAYPFAYDPLAQEYRIYEGTARTVLERLYGTGLDLSQQKVLTAGAGGAAAGGPFAAASALAGAAQAGVAAEGKGAAGALLAGT